MSIIVKDLTFVYNPKTSFSKVALDNVNLTVADGEFLGIIGHTGSGKSTFVQHLNCLVRIQSGSIVIGDMDLSQKKIDLKKLRATVGMVFQYPEYQLFADNVYNDVAFGPKNIGIKGEELEKRVTAALQKVGLDCEKVKDKSPFDMSGGERRRVALAGVLAMEPSILVLDEPTAGLDPVGKEEILSLVKNLNQQGVTVIMVSHDMNEIYENCSKVAVFVNGKISCCLPTQELFESNAQILDWGLDIPVVARIKNLVKEKKGVTFSGVTTKEIAESIMSEIKIREGVKGV